MDGKTADYELRIQDWERRAPWYRRISARTGLEGKLVLSFTFLLLVTLVMSSIQFVRFSTNGAELIVIAVGGVSALICLPLIYLLVRRIFHPIRALVDATNRIAAGDLEAQVAVHRPDVIGTLARSFNEMVKTVRKQQEELEEKVRVRTAEVEAVNEKLRNEIAEKEDFLRAVSHDLNAPLRNIAGMASMLLMKHRDRFDDDIIHRLERIQKNVQIETDLIGELLELSRIKTRREKLEPVDLNTVVDDLANVFEDDLQSKGISLFVDTKLPIIHGERARMSQLFQNLIDNAIKYMGDGDRKEIHIGCEAKIDHAEFYVSDTGSGIEPADLDKVFCIFRRGKSPVVQAVAGKGIGLASVKSIVETYDGTIRAESAVGHGTTFRFSLNGKYLFDAQPAPQGRAA